MQEKIKAMANNVCSICNKHLENEDAPILVMGAYGTPRLLCDGCAEDLEKATSSREYDEIASSMESVGKKLVDSDPDELTLKTVNDLLSSAAQRAKSIKDGTYDFSLDEKMTDGFELDDIPEELKESEEDVTITEAQEARDKKIDKIFNWISIVLFSAIGAYALYTIIRLFF